METLALSCQCGAVKGSAIDITASNSNRVVCCCSDCQAFAWHLHRADTLDEFGGTEIFQTSLSQVKIDQGHDQLQSLRLTSKGLLRWYTACCNTPVANTASLKIPFAGIIHTFWDTTDKDQLGPIRAHVQTRDAIGTPDYPDHSAKFPVGITLRIMRQVLTWKLQGKGKPSVFFADDGKPVKKPIIVNKTVNNE